MNKLLALVAMMVASGCSTVSDVLNDNTLIAGVVAYKATVEIIELSDDPEARAGRVADYASAAESLVSSTESVNLDVLYQAVHDLIDWDDIPPVDRPLVEDLLVMIRDRIAREVDEFATLTPESEVSLKHVISRIRMAAEYYA